MPSCSKLGLLEGHLMIGRERIALEALAAGKPTDPVTTAQYKRRSTTR